jgi:hypothetical protein
VVLVLGKIKNEIHIEFFLALLFLLIFLLTPFLIFTQEEKKENNDLLFGGTNINSYSLESDTNANITFSGYLDTYFACYTDTSNGNNFQKFPTISPKNNQIGINIVQFSAKYESEKLHSTATLFFGDCPTSSWSPVLNYIQEANIGFKVYKNLWFDAGFFRSHIGIESIQPRENMALGLATTTYFEPYFLSGAKITWALSKKITFQANVFNSFNQFIETNKNKVVGFSASYSPSKKLNLSLNTLFCDESPNSSLQTHKRYYTNFYSIYKIQRLTIGFDVNFAIQEHSNLYDSTKSATMFSSILALKYRITSKFSSYLRGEYFSDPNEILTGPIENENHQLVGLDCYGVTFGFEFKPIPNSYLRVEGRYLELLTNDKIFYYNQTSRKFRYEFLAGIGVWF